MLPPHPPWNQGFFLFVLLVFSLLILATFFLNASSLSLVYFLSLQWFFPLCVPCHNQLRKIIRRGWCSWFHSFMQIGFIRLKVLSGIINSFWSEGSAMSGERAVLLMWLATFLVVEGFSWGSYSTTVHLCGWTHCFNNEIVPYQLVSRSCLEPTEGPSDPQDPLTSSNEWVNARQSRRCHLHWYLWPAAFWKINTRPLVFWLSSLVIKYMSVILKYFFLKKTGLGVHYILRRSD